MKFKLIFILFLYACFTGCSTKDDRPVIPNYSKKSIAVRSLDIDSVIIDASNTSSMGFFYMEDSLIYFIDKMFASLYTYGLDGQYIDRYLGRGNGPNELPHIRKIFPTDSGKVLYGFDSGNMMYEIDKTDWTVSKKGIIDFGWGKRKVSGTDPTSPSMYKYNVLNYFNFSFEEIPGTDKMIFPVHSESRNYSGSSVSSNADFYYKTARIFGVLDKNSVKVDKVFGYKSDLYNSYKYIPNFEGMSFTIKNADTIFVNFFPDPLIYSYKFSEDNPTYSFGNGGVDMRQDYPVTHSYDEAVKRLQSDAMEYGYYATLKYIHETNLLFRGYYKGGNPGSDGLQIYKGTTLIADVDVPLRFQVIGYREPYYYAARYWPDQYDQTFVFFKFKV